MRGPARVVLLLLAAVGHAELRAGADRSVQPLPGDERNEHKKVLVLYPMRRDEPAMQAFDAEFRRLLGEALGTRLDYYSEYLDSGRFGEPARLSALRQFLSRKYRGERFDLVVVSDAGAEFVARGDLDPFRGVPLVFAVNEQPVQHPNSTGVLARPDFGSTVRVATALQPETRHVFVVSGASESDRWYETDARRQFQQFEGGLTFTYLSGLAMTDLHQRISSLPPKSVIYYISVQEDGAGNKFVLTDVIEGLSSVANAPMYSWLDVAMDRGVVGGSMMSMPLLARRIAEPALRVLNGESPRAIPVVRVDFNVTQLDWRQLRRWNISGDRVPVGSTVLFREPGAWERYKVYIAGAISLIAIQMVLIGVLVVNRAKRRRAEASLRASHARIQDLAGRLITAQEAERRRIARELHDDVGQRLATFAITLSGLKSRLADAPKVVEEDVTSLHHGTLELSKDLRKLSHELHPGILEHLGLAQALRNRCDAFSVEAGVAVGVEVAPDLGDLPDRAALCLYRVGQEALQNVAKHAGARSVRVSLRRDNGRVAMRVADDGAGFDMRAGHHGLGLVSLDERVRMLGGTFTIESSRGEGTTVSVTLPVEKS